MKVAFFNSHNLWPSHYETELELIQNHLDCGDEVFQLTCFADLRCCDLNWEGSVDICVSCIEKRKTGTKLLTGPISVRSIDDYFDEGALDAKVPKVFSSLEELKSTKLDGFDIGASVASSIISLSRISSPDLNKFADLVNQYMIDTAKVYYSFKRFLSEVKPERVYVFNGRFAHTRAIFRACQNFGVDCWLHERGQSPEYYGLFKNHFPHSIKAFTKNALILWNRIEGKEAIADEFFTSRRKGQNKDWFSFISNQKEGALPNGWDARTHNVVIFNSSEDEMAAIDDEWENGTYRSQIDAIKKICEDLSASPHVRLYLRLHPNIAKAEPQELEPYMDLEYSNLVVIPPTSNISTYLLIEKADTVLTFGSTVGIEAVYWRKPSILIGSAFYMHLGGTYNPQSHEELIPLLREKLAVKNLEPALIYGCYFQSFGTPFNHVQGISLSQVTFRGRDLSKPGSGPVTKVVRRVLKVLGPQRKMISKVLRFIYE